MFEFLFGAVLVSLYLPRRARKKLEKANKLAGTGKKVRGLDAVLRRLGVGKKRRWVLRP